MIEVTNSLRGKFERNATIAFNEAIDALPLEFNAGASSKLVEALALREKHKLTSFKIAAVGRRFNCFLEQSGRGILQKSSSAGTVLLHLADKSKGWRTGFLGIPYSFSDLKPNSSASNKKISFSLDLGPQMEFGAENSRLAERATAFSHVALTFRGKIAVVFVPVLQKLTVDDRSKRVKDRPVDLYVGDFGPDRHLLFLRAVEQIAEHMRSKGIETEVHAPAPETICPKVAAGVLERIRKPFVKLEEHFERDSLQFHGEMLPTINLSRPKHA